MTNLTQPPGPAAHAVPHLTVEERMKLGKEARARAPRSSQAEFSPARTARIRSASCERQATTRVPDLVPIRYGRMLVSPFTFFRGAALDHGRPTWPPRPAPGSMPRSAAMPTCRTSACSPRPSAT